MSIEVACSSASTNIARRPSREALWAASGSNGTWKVRIAAARITRDALAVTFCAGGGRTPLCISRIAFLAGDTAAATRLPAVQHRLAHIGRLSRHHITRAEGGVVRYHRGCIACGATRDGPLGGRLISLLPWVLIAEEHLAPLRLGINIGHSERRRSHI